MRHVPSSLVAAGKIASTGTHAATTTHDVSATSLLVQMVIGLVVVVALIKVASRLLEGRVGRGGLGRARGRETITVLGRHSLGKGVQVAVVAAADTTFVLGITQQQVTVLGQPALPGPDAGADAAEDVLLHAGGLQLVGDADLAGPGQDGSSPWRSTLEQMRTKTVRRA